MLPLFELGIAMDPTENGPLDIGLFRLAERRLAWVGMRQQLLAQNVANASTPGFQPRDLPPFAAALAHAQPSATMARTSPSHLAGTDSAQHSRQVRPREHAMDGNGVSMEEQLIKVADTAGAQELVANLYRKYHGMFRTALGRG